MLTRLLILASCVALIGCGGSPPREYPADQLGEIIDTHRVQIEWSRGAGKGISAIGDDLVAAVDGDEVVVVDRRGRLSAFALESGRQRWRHNTGLAVSAGPVVTESLILLGTRDGRVVALDRESRETRWDSGVTSEVLALPAVDGDTVAVLTNDGRVFALRTESGARRWLYDRTMPPLTLRGTSRPVITTNRVYVGLPSGLIVALNREDGSRVWEARAGVARGSSDIERMRDVMATPVIYQGMLHAVAYQGDVISLDPGRGSTDWSRPLSSSAGLAVDRERVYVTEANGRIWALDRDSGAAVWRQDDTEGLRATAPVLHEDKVLIADDRGGLTWLDARDGSILARSLIGDDPISQTPVVTEHGLIVLNDVGRLYRVGLQSQD